MERRGFVRGWNRSILSFFHLAYFFSILSRFRASGMGIGSLLVSSLDRQREETNTNETWSGYRFPLGIARERERSKDSHPIPVQDEDREKTPIGRSFRSLSRDSPCSAEDLQVFGLPRMGSVRCSDRERILSLSLSLRASFSFSPWCSSSDHPKHWEEEDKRTNPRPIETRSVFIPRRGSTRGERDLVREEGGVVDPRRKERDVRGSDPMSFSFPFLWMTSLSPLCIHVVFLPPRGSIGSIAKEGSRKKKIKKDRRTDIGPRVRIAGIASNDLLKSTPGSDPSPSSNLWGEG